MLPIDRDGNTTGDAGVVAEDDGITSNFNVGKANGSYKHYRRIF